MIRSTRAKIQSRLQSVITLPFTMKPCNQATPKATTGAAGQTRFPAIPALYLGRMDPLGFAEGSRQLLEVYLVQVPVCKQTRDPATASQDKTRPPAQRRLGKQVQLHPKPSHNTEPSLSLQNNLSRFVDCRCIWENCSIRTKALQSVRGYGSAKWVRKVPLKVPRSWM